MQSGTFEQVLIWDRGDRNKCEQVAPGSFLRQRITRVAIWTSEVRRRKLMLHISRISRLKAKTITFRMWSKPKLTSHVCQRNCAIHSSVSCSHLLCVYVSDIKKKSSLASNCAVYSFARSQITARYKGKQCLSLFELLSLIKEHVVIVYAVHNAYFICPYPFARPLPEDQNPQRFLVDTRVYLILRDKFTKLQKRCLIVVSSA